MPNITTYSAKFVQPFTLIFECGFCGARFENQGEYSSVVKLDKWEPSYKIAKAPEAEMLSRGIANLEEIREFHVKSIKQELIKKRLVIIIRSTSKMETSARNADTISAVVSLQN